MERLIDLSFPLAEGQPSFPGDPAIRLEDHATLERDGFHLTHLHLSAHHGTHMDAPLHCLEGGEAIDRIPLGRCYGPAVLVDLAPGGALGPGARILEEHLQPHAEAFLPGARVLLRTGWDRRHGAPAYYEGFPALDPAAARWIAGRDIGLLGLDTPSPDADGLECHRILQEDCGILILECLRNLHLLPERFTLIALPLAIAGREGSPVRAAAVVEGE